MAGFQGMRYTEMLHLILQSAEERLGIVARPQLAQAVAGNGVQIPIAHSVAGSLQAAVPPG